MDYIFSCNISLFSNWLRKLATKCFCINETNPLKRLSLDRVEGVIFVATL